MWLHGLAPGQPVFQELLHFPRLGHHLSHAEPGDELADPYSQAACWAPNDRALLLQNIVELGGATLPVEVWRQQGISICSRGMCPDQLMNQRVLLTSERPSKLQSLTLSMQHQ